MKIGDLVRMTGEVTTQQVWYVTNVKSNSKGYWIQIDDNCKVADVWYNSQAFEVVNENR